MRHRGIPVHRRALGDNEGVWYVVVAQTKVPAIVTTGFSSDTGLTEVRTQYGIGFSIWEFDDNAAQMAFIADFAKTKAEPLVPPKGARKVSGGMSTPAKVVIAGAALVALYLFTR